MSDGMKRLKPIREHLDRAAQSASEIQRCEADLDALFFQRRTLSIAPPPVHFFRSTPVVEPQTSAAPQPDNTRAEEIFASSLHASSVGQRIRQFREAAGLTQKELAEATGIRRPNIARLEKGNNLPNLSTLVKLAAALQTTVVSLVSTDA